MLVRVLNTSYISRIIYCWVVDERVIGKKNILLFTFKIELEDIR